ncbi:MAG: hypothetical protein NVV74_24500 [Magnetospirillum sp.]|nr:hypothetical protein [Magnetospirillum sp.]
MNNDWKMEARRLLAQMGGNNDNAQKEASPSGIHFHGPVTVNVAIGDGLDATIQRLTLQARLQGYLAAEGDAVAKAFREELEHAYGRNGVDTLTNSELVDLMANINKLLRAARMLAATPKR